MGASGWAYFVPYQEDIVKALQELREEVFKKGAYFNSVSYSLKQFIVNGYDPHTTHPRYRFTEDDLRRWRSSYQPETIEDLIRIQGDSGTHSIIDIDGISPTPAFRMAAPLPEQHLEEMFSTREPTRIMIERKIPVLQDLRRRWEGTYVIVCENGTPAEIFFTGYSGD